MPAASLPACARLLIKPDHAPLPADFRHLLRTGCDDHARNHWGLRSGRFCANLPGLVDCVCCRREAKGRKADCRRQKSRHNPVFDPVHDFFPFHGVDAHNLRGAPDSGNVCATNYSCRGMNCAFVRRTAAGSRTPLRAVGRVSPDAGSASFPRPPQKLGQAGLLRALECGAKRDCLYSLGEDSGAAGKCADALTKKRFHVCAALRVA
jgi:hypothetical protein